MHQLDSFEGYQPLQFSQAEIDEMYERMEQKKEHRRREAACLKAMQHEAMLAELPTIDLREEHLRIAKQACHLSATNHFIRLLIDVAKLPPIDKTRQPFELPTIPEVLNEYQAIPEPILGTCKGCAFLQARLHKLCLSSIYHCINNHTIMSPK